MQKAGDRPNESEQIREAMANFPVEFGLRGFPTKVFRISASKSYRNDAGIQLVLQVMRKSTPSQGCDGDMWIDFGKGTVSDLQGQVVDLYSNFTPINYRES
jgi:hypothetical protein